MSENDCGHQKEARKKLYRRLFTASLAFIITVLFIILLVWLILRPKSPTFVMQEATLYAFNVNATTTPNLLTLTLQISISSHNPNNRIGIYYDKLGVYASYRSQKVTLPTLLPSTYQSHKDVTVWSPILYGYAVPVAPYISVSLGQDQTAGTVLFDLKVMGKVRWKVGSFISGRHSLHVNCPAYITFGDKNNGLAVGPEFKFQLVQRCNVDV